jgi:hypothetical protein
MANPLIGYKRHQNSMNLGHHQRSFFKFEILVMAAPNLEWDFFFIIQNLNFKLHFENVRKM